MIRVEDHGDVVHVRTARTLAGCALYWGGCYLVDGLLLDCGPPATAREFLRFVAGRSVMGLVLTHHHEDHMGAAPLLAAERRLVPLAHPLALPLLERGFEQELYRRAVWGTHGRVKAEPLGAQVRSRHLTFEVLHTPGHSADHVCLFEPEHGWLFTGDLFLAERLRYLRSDEELVPLIDSLEAVCRLPAKAVYCAHRGPVEGGLATLRRKAQFLQDLRGRVLDLLRQGLPEREVARRAVGPEGIMTLISLGRFSARNFVRSLAAVR